MEGSTVLLNLKQDAKQNIQLSSMQVEPHDQAPVKDLVLVAAIAIGMQFGWALQLSLLTPYVQLLGIPHKLAPIIWLCGPISGMLVPPLVGYYSDNCTSRYGRRQPFIAAGAALVVVAAFLISFATDIGHKSGDRLGRGVIKSRAIVVFAVGFGTLDIANNMLACPCRALLADLSGGDAKKTRMSNAGFSFFIAIGNLLGYAAGSYKNMYHIFPFTKTTACDIYCANLKSCFFISIFLLLTLTILALSLVHEKPFFKEESDDINNKSSKQPFFLELFSAIKNSSKPMRILMLVTCFNWIGWFPFFLFDTDWTGREVYGGKVGTLLYDQGVHLGALGLLLNSVVLGFSSMILEYLGNKMGGVKRLWGVVNFLLVICLAMTVPVSKLAASTRRADGKPAAGVKVAALAIFSLLGIPLSVTFSIPSALASIFANDSGLGQGLSLAVLNLSVVIPQMVISLVSGQWDELFGGGNLPAFVVGAIAAALSGIFAITLLPLD